MPDRVIPTKTPFPVGSITVTPVLPRVIRSTAGFATQASSIDGRFVYDSIKANATYNARTAAISARSLGKSFFMLAVVSPLPFRRPCADQIVMVDGKFGLAVDIEPLLNRRLNG